MTQILTDAQQQAVEHKEGPLLVLAGPGSGKTRVITCRIARLLEQGVRPDEILALTFTNKAAREMAERVQKLLGDVRLRVTTFHRFCSGILRRWPESVGLRQNFSILDHSDQVHLIRKIMKDEGLDTSFHDPSAVLNRISRARNELVSADEFRRRYEERVGDPLDAVVYHVFPRYEQSVLHQNAVDFDDLLLHVVHLLQDDEELRRFLDSHYRFILVDEYQDTNLAQYRIIRSLSHDFPNLCATGDPDQSIYGWRGARPENLATFQRDFPDVRIISLDQNFRSTQSIVSCADQLISHNYRPHRGQLHTVNPVGEPARILLFENAEQEAAGIAAEISERVAAGERTFSDFAIFYRVNALSRQLETALSRKQVPFQVAAGFSFYERTEIRDLIAYLRLIENQADDIAMERIINRPMRGIGSRTLALLVQHAQSAEISLFEAATQADQITGLTARSRKPLRMFVDLISRLHHLSADGAVEPVLKRLIDDVNYLSMWKEDADSIDIDRQANVHELVAAARLFDASVENDTGEHPSLQGFLELACLSSEVDNVDPSRGRVTLMTMHAAKGLEFPVVIIAGVENGLIPHERAVRNGDPAGFDEERRLLYVGITRAKLELTLTQTMERTFRGMRRSTISSPFIGEIDSVVVRQTYRNSCQGESEDRTDLNLRNWPEPDESVTAAQQKLHAARQRFEAAQNQPGRPLLITAAQLELQRQSHQSSAASVFSTGMLVRHPRFGRGVITAVSPPSSRSTVTVRFEIDDRTETFVAGKCPLQPIGPN